MFNLFRISIFFLLILNTTPILSSEEENLRFLNWINETKNYLTNFKSVSGNFTQIDNIGNISKGTFWISEKKEMAFYYSAPSETIIIYREGNLFFKERKVDNFQKYKVDNNPIFQLLDKQSNIEKYLKNGIVDSNIVKFKINLSKSSDRNTLSVIMDFPKPKLRQWKFIDQQKKETNIFFSKINYLKNISNEYFNTK
ncbi:MAG: outer-membrane lipoprotein carrier protein LolA [Pseudomonadota bacterium]|nr:outer-membrane lipoprotein carrier protein LolA [Pseudomonadota bacterium]MEC9414873.1 outer-membrane lipoprotein carrier protein LolA [Pseudomonadota bacterium]|tara:strand:- start:536 stop:1126 length:591 start_codon:yes stop_codon:yes gene_type:complete